MEFTKLADVTLVAETTDITNVFIEEDGEIKRVPKTEVGGTGKVIIKSSEYDAAIQTMLSGGAAPSDLGSSDATYTCINMTFEEAYDALANGEYLDVVLMDTMGSTPITNISLLVAFGGIAFTGSPAIMLLMPETNFGGGYISKQFMWTASGITQDIEQ